MKYMGSKRAMLQNGLGDLLGSKVMEAHRFVDLFAGSGAVAIHVAQRFDIPVLAFDLQLYSAILTGAVISRLTTFSWQEAWDRWCQRAQACFACFKVPITSRLNSAIVEECRAWCSEQIDLAITRSYGGHYFSPLQAVWIDAYRFTLPRREPAKTVALAALIQAASKCAAAPGHTAQPFQPTPTAMPFLQEAWSKNITQHIMNAFSTLAQQSARQAGVAQVGDANQVAEGLMEGDLVFVDPPYSGVQYSRFYHVLEAIARGDFSAVSGVGRYPSRDFRPRSRYSTISESAVALNDLLSTLASNGAKTIITFPDHDCSNGLSGKLVRQIAAEYYSVQENLVESAFSTLGGTGDMSDSDVVRAARRRTRELILVLG